MFRKVAERNRLARCPSCKVRMDRVQGLGGIQVWDSEKEFTNFSDRGERFRTKGDLRKRCRDMGVNCGALL